MQYFTNLCVRRLIFFKKIRNAKLKVYYSQGVGAKCLLSSFLEKFLLTLVTGIAHTTQQSIKSLWNVAHSSNLRNGEVTSDLVLTSSPCMPFLTHLMNHCSGIFENVFTQILQSYMKYWLTFQAYTKLQTPPKHRVH